ncbi:protein NATD1 isoform X1 [Eptesicus fuscus]|uniref:protein NATD1 isoform X1 n=1 Tax=Eptesicus fuscus TaxID=29078 RepID=UPI002403AFC8|nr:protein NATD1 isoform X1 [Eptesicus fuscus]
MAHSPAAAPGAQEPGCPIRVEHDRRRRQFTVRLNGFRKLRPGRGRVSELRADPCPAGGDVSQPKAVLPGGGGEDGGHRQAVTGVGRRPRQPWRLSRRFPQSLDHDWEEGGADTDILSSER